MNTFRKVPLPYVRIFEVAGRTLSFAVAANELSLTPSAVSHSIRKLEEMIGVKLFQRSTREVRLTKEGAQLLEHIQRGIDEMQRGFALVTNEARSPLRLHAAPSFAMQWLLPRLAGFVRDHPDIDLQVSASTEYARFDDDFDLDIVYGDPRSSPHETIPLAQEGLAPLCSPELAAQIRSPQDLYRLPLIQCALQRYQWKGWFEANDLIAPAHYGLKFDRSAMAIAAAVDGLGIVLESTLMAERELNAGKLVRPLSGTREVKYIGHYLAYPRRAYHHEAFDTFKAWLLDQLGVGADNT
jgi:LysR family glycine cleavage system transcriptional activator